VIPIDGRRSWRQTVITLDLVPDDRHQAPTRDTQIYGFPPSCRTRGSVHTPSWVVRMRHRLAAPGLPLTVPPFSNSDEPLLHPTRNPKVFGLTSVDLVPVATEGCWRSFSSNRLLPPLTSTNEPGLKHHLGCAAPHPHRPRWHIGKLLDSARALPRHRFAKAICYGLDPFLLSRLSSGSFDPFSFDTYAQMCTILYLPAPISRVLKKRSDPTLPNHTQCTSPIN
jgi:hypothetical protein